MIEDFVRQALHDGYAYANLGSVEQRGLIYALRRLGAVRERTLVPKYSTTDGRLTLSNKFGFGEFPFHTDRAFDVRPPRIVALFDDSSRSTAVCTKVAALQSLPKPAQKVLRRAMWIKLERHGESYLPGMFMTNMGNGYRFDTSLMRPGNAVAEHCANGLHEVFEELSLKIDWTRANTVLIDNWNSVHARGAVEKADVGVRRLTRLEVWVHEGMAVGELLGQGR